MAILKFEFQFSVFNIPAQHSNFTMFNAWFYFFCIT